ncbi:hypothetical protein R3W88_004327 [Solanum pinnatisectum]|uniref:Uncharacterized protein n=1 Tax=Solanum pinnatisectum TaxID=50273 RepID=A0AAV9K914_9SOLN|nr:hypothetical protein R3W88_004327 [Solanum pinnatisectum]
MLSRYILTIESGNSKMDQVLDVMSLPGVVLIKTLEEMGIVQQFHFKDGACLLISFGGRDYIVPVVHSAHALPMRYIDANSLYSVLSRQKSDLVASRNMYVDTIFMKPTIQEDLYLHKLFFRNKGTRTSECLFHVDPSVNLFMVKLGGMVKVNCEEDDIKWTLYISLLFIYFYDSHLKGNTQSTERRKTDMPMLSEKTSSQLVGHDLILFGTNSVFLAVLKITMSLKEPLGAWGEKKLTVEKILEHQNVSTDQYTHSCLDLTYSTDEISFWVDTIVCPMINFYCICAFECTSVISIVTCKWFKVVQLIEVVRGFNDNISLCEIVSEKRPIFIVIALNLEDKALIEERCIVMNGP